MVRRCVDLADPPARDAFLTEALAGATKALVLTEGLLMHLTDGDAAALSQSHPTYPVSRGRTCGEFAA